nr:hypothetical protein Itr_chr06CG14140 [Ipomoea trifida]
MLNGRGTSVAAARRTTPSQSRQHRHPLPPPCIWEEQGMPLLPGAMIHCCDLPRRGSSSLEVKDGASPTPPLETTESPIELPSSPLQAVLTSEVGAALLLGVVARRESEVTGWSRWSNGGEHSAEAVRYLATEGVAASRKGEIAVEPLLHWHGYASCSAPQACQGNLQGVRPNRAGMSRLGGAFQTLRDEREAKREEHNTLRNNHSCLQHEYQALAERCKKQEEEHALAIQHTTQNAIRDWRAHGRAHKRLAGGLGLLPVY